MTREEAIYWLDHSDLSRVKFYEAVGYAIEALKDNAPKAMAQLFGESTTFGKWVSCKDRLPEENIPVLLCVRFKDDFKYFVTTRMDYNYWTGLGRDIRGELAWMELPSPYREEE